MRSTGGCRPLLPVRAGGWQTGGRADVVRRCVAPQGLRQTDQLGRRGLMVDSAIDPVTTSQAGWEMIARPAILPRIKICDLGRTGNSMLTSF